MLLALVDLDGTIDKDGRGFGKSSRIRRHKSARNAPLFIFPISWSLNMPLQARLPSAVW